MSELSSCHLAEEIQPIIFTLYTRLHTPPTHARVHAHISDTRWRTEDKNGTLAIFTFIDMRMSMLAYFASFKKEKENNEQIKDFLV